MLLMWIYGPPKQVISKGCRFRSVTFYIGKRERKRQYAKAHTNRRCSWRSYSPLCLQVAESEGSLLPLTPVLPLLPALLSAQLQNPRLFRQAQVTGLRTYQPAQITVITL